MTTWRLLLTGLLLAVSNVALAQGVTLPEVGRIELENGVVIILLEKDEVPLIGVEAHIRGGASADPEGLGGMADLVAGMLMKGAGERDAATFAEAVGAVGGDISAVAQTESIRISAEFMARDVDLMVELLADMLRAPLLIDDEIVKLRDRSIFVLRSAKDGDMRSLLSTYGNAFLYGEHPYGNSMYGTEESLAAISPAAVRDFYANHFGGDRLVISVAGDFEASAMAGKLNAAFADWPAAAADLPPIDAPTKVNGRKVLLVDEPGAAQSYFWIGSTGVSVHYPARAELNIANTLFGGRYTATLNRELRTRAGLTYSVWSYLRRMSAGGSFAIESSTKTESTIEAIDLTLKLLDELRQDGVAEDLLDSGKNYILGQYAPNFETAAQLARQFALLELNGLDASYVDDYGAAVASADSEAIRAVINEVYPSTDDLAFVIVGDAEAIREAVAKYGTVTEMPLSDPRFAP